MGIFTMPYIWEQPNKGNTLYEMAIIRQKGLVEAETPAPAPDDIVKFEIPAEKNNEGTARTIIGGLSKKYGVNPEYNDGGIVMTKEDFAKCSDGVKAYIGAKLLTPNDAVKNATAAEDERKTENTRASVVKQVIEQFKDKDIQNQLAIAVRCLMNGVWFDGKEPNDQQKATVQHCQELLKSGKPAEVVGLLKTIVGLEHRGVISLDPKNAQLFKVNKGDTKFTGDVQMPTMFDSEPDDSMWDDMVITQFGIAMINLSHPAVKKIIQSENPEEDCPQDLKSFKKAVYGDKRLQVVFGKGGFERVILGKLANLLTLGIAAATMDEGKRADRIIKELKEKGGHTAHRNLLLVNYEDIVDADPDNDSVMVPAKAYSRSKREFIGDIEIPASAVAQFYSAVDPVNSAKIYLEMLGNEKSGVSLDIPMEEAVSALEEALLEGTISDIAGLVPKGIAKLSHKVAGSKDPGKGESKPGDDGKFAEVKQKFMDYLSKKGHPPAYILKAKSANKEVDIVSSAETGRGQASGVVHMVSMKIGDHQAAAFMKPEDIKKYFSA